MAGKTGTSQVVSSKNATPGAPDQEDHALFVAYAPAQKPAYAIAVVIEHGGGGSRAAAPVARDVMTHLFENQLLARTPYDGSGAPDGDQIGDGQPVARG